MGFIGVELSDSGNGYFKLNGAQIDPGLSGIGFDLSVEPSLTIDKYISFDASGPGEVTLSLFSTPQVPGPATIGLLGTGLMGLAMGWRRKSKP